MSTKGDELTGALCEVRKAYRVLYAYQKRALDICLEIADYLQLQFFYSWYFPAIAPRPRMTPFKSGSWDFLPLADANMLFSKSGDESFSKRGDWMIEIRIVSDSAYKDAWEPSGSTVNPLEDFASPESSETYLMIYGWIRTQNERGKWIDVHDAAPWPEPGKLLSLDAMAVYGKRPEFAELADSSSMEKALRKMTAELQSRLGFKHLSRR
jgi:hypothetical protein